MTEEPTEETNVKSFEEADPRIMPASHLGADVSRHYETLELCGVLKANEAFPVSKHDHSLKLLRELCADKSTTAKPLVVLEHDEVYEVRLLPKGQSPKVFYSYVGKTQKTIAEESGDGFAQAILDNINAAFESDPADLMKYEAALTASWITERIVSYSMIHRRTSSLSLFRKSPDGATVSLKKGFQELVEQGKVETVPKSYMEDKFDFSGVAYRLLAE